MTVFLVQTECWCWSFRLTQRRKSIQMPKEENIVDRIRVWQRMRREEKRLTSLRSNTSLVGGNVHHRIQNVSSDSGTIQPQHITSPVYFIYSDTATLPAFHIAGSCGCTTPAVGMYNNTFTRYANPGCGASNVCDTSAPDSWWCISNVLIDQVVLQGMFALE